MGSKAQAAAPLCSTTFINGETFWRGSPLHNTMWSPVFLFVALLFVMAHNACAEASKTRQHDICVHPQYTMRFIPPAVGALGLRNFDRAHKFGSAVSDRRMKEFGHQSVYGRPAIHNHPPTTTDCCDCFWLLTATGFLLIADYHCLIGYQPPLHCPPTTSIVQSRRASTL